MHLSARCGFGEGDKGWQDYLEFLGVTTLTQIRTIDTGLNETVEGSDVVRCCSLENIDDLLVGLPGPEYGTYFQLAVNLAEESAIDSVTGLTLLGYDLSDETWTSSLLNCVSWSGSLEVFVSDVNEFGLLDLQSVRRAQEALPEVWGEDNPHAFVDVWQLWEVDPSLRHRLGSEP